MTHQSAIPSTSKDSTSRNVAKPFHLKLRHHLLMVSFLVIVVAPLLVGMLYLWGIARDQYSSEAGFTVRKEEGGSTSELLGGVLQFAGGSLASDSDILYEYIRSRDIVDQVNNSLDLRAHYSQYYPIDWFFSVAPEGAIEDLADFWRRIVRVDFDQSTGLIALRVTALDPETAKRIVEQIVQLSQDKVNALNAQAREDALRFSREDLEMALERLKSAREALVRFQTSTLILDPQADFQSRMGVLGNLQQQLAAALTEYDLLVGNSSDADPRATQAQRRIDVIQSRIEKERETLASDVAADSDSHEGFPKLFAQYEELVIDREYAENTYRVALAAHDAAKTSVTRNSRYLATYIEPTLAESSAFPQRGIIWGLAALFLCLAWGTSVLIYYSIRDRG